MFFIKGHYTQNKKFYGVLKDISVCMMKENKSDVWTVVRAKRRRGPYAFGGQGSAGAPGDLDRANQPNSFERGNLS